MALALRAYADAAGQPFDEATLRSLSMDVDEPSAAGLARAWAGAVGWSIRIHKATDARLRDTPVPFVLTGAAHREVWLVRERKAGRLVLVDPGTGRTTDLEPRAASAIGRSIITFGAQSRPDADRSTTPAAAELESVAAAAPPAAEPEFEPDTAPAERGDPKPPAVADPVRRPRNTRRRDGAASVGQEPRAAALGEDWRGELIRSLRPALVEVATASVIINLMALATPVFMMTVYNRVISHAAVATLDALVLGMATLVLFEYALRSLRGRIASHAGARLDLALGTAVMRRLLALPYSELRTLADAGMIERLRRLDTLRSFLTGQLPLLLVDLAFVGLFVLAIFAIAPPLGWLTLAAMPLFVLVSWLYQHRQRGLQRSGFQTEVAKAESLAEAIGQALTVKALAAESVLEDRYRSCLSAGAVLAYRAGRVSTAAMGVGQAIQQGVALLLVYVGASSIIAGQMSIGALIATTILASRALGPMRHLVGAFRQLQDARAIFAELAEVMRRVPERTVGRAGDLHLAGVMQLEDVTFAYPDAPRPALRKVSLEFRPGSMVAIVGPPGSGKSTLLKLLAALERPVEGRVLVDGNDLADIDPRQWRAALGIVPQDIQLFAGSVADNIALGAGNVPPERIAAAARFAGLDEIVARLPSRYETRLAGRAEILSPGQRQLVAIARALVRNPRIMLLDEATSALDAALEEQLLANLRRASSGRTILFVTHRATVVAKCDRVVMLGGGEVLRDEAPGAMLRSASGQRVQTG